MELHFQNYQPGSGVSLWRGRENVGGPVIAKGVLDQWSRISGRLLDQLGLVWWLRKGGRTAGPPTPSPGQGFLPPCIVNEGVCVWHLFLGTHPYVSVRILGPGSLSWCLGHQKSLDKSLPFSGETGRKARTVPSTPPTPKSWVQRCH